MAHPLTVIIPCKNEADNIRACIESVRAVADEILVADSGSTDGTLEIVREAGGCRIIEREFIDFSSFKNWALQHATHPWVLIIDADERVSGPLAEEIGNLLAGEPPADAYWIHLTNFFVGNRIRFSGWRSDRVLRLFRCEVCRYGKQRVHEHLEVDTGKTARLDGELLHYTCRSLDHWLEKVALYTTLAAEDMLAAGLRVTYLGLLLRPPLRFLQSYILRGGFLDGTAGLAVCTGAAIYTFMKYAKLWELRSTSVTASGRRGGRPNKMQRVA